MEFLRLPGIEKLYSGELMTNASFASIRALNSAAPRREAAGHLRVVVVRGRVELLHRRPIHRGALLAHDPLGNARQFGIERSGAERRGEDEDLDVTRHCSGSVA
jgi:hypothetical protein